MKLHPTKFPSPQPTTWAIVLLSLFLITKNLSAQKDTEFWFAAPEIANGGNGGNYEIPVRFVFSTYEQAATVTLSQPANPVFTPRTINLPADQSDFFEFPPDFQHVENDQANVVLNRGFLLKSTAPITAYYECIGGINQANPELYSMKGRNALGILFYTPFQNKIDNSITYTPKPHSSFDIVATENGTTVKIRPTTNLVGHSANVSFSINLNRGQTFSCQASSVLAGGHPSGSKIESNKPIAVTIKDDLLEGSQLYSGTCRDQMGDQIIPVDKLGQEYVVQKGELSGAEFAFIVATQNGTQVFQNGNLIGTIDEGETLAASISQQRNFIKTSSPVYVLQMTGNGCEVAGEVLPSLECGGSWAVRFVRSKFEPFWLFLATESGNEGSFILNENANLIDASSFQAVPGSGGKYVSAVIPFSNEVPSGLSSIVENTKGVFQMGFLNGQEIATGCRFGYFSDFGKVQYTSDTVSLCQGDTIFINNFPVFGTGTFFDTIPGIQGCDTVKIYVAKSAQLLIQQREFSLCPGEKIEFDGKFYTAPNLILDTLKNAIGIGCDTLRVTDLKLLPLPTGQRNLNICQNDSIEINGKFHHPPAIILDTIPSVSGCDTLMLFKLNALPYIPENQTVALCPEVFFEFKGEQFKAPAILFDTLFSENACDTVLTIELVQIPSPETSREIFLCKGEWVVVGGKVYDFETVVNDTFPSENACDTVRTTQIFIDQPLHPFLQNDTSVCSGEQAVLKSPYPETVWNGNFSGQNFVMTGPGLAIAAAVNENGCPLRDSVWVRTCCAEEGIFVPNVFSPDDNGKNDEFRAFASELCRQFTLSIYDRWGELIFFSEDPEKGWNGKFRGKPCPSDVYVWVLELNEGGSRKTEIKKGSVALIR